MDLCLITHDHSDHSDHLDHLDHLDEAGLAKVDSEATVIVPMLLINTLKQRHCNNCVF